MIDLQINGYAGVDFNELQVDPEQLERACRLLEQDGVRSVLVTLITDDLDRLELKLRHLVALREEIPVAGRVIGGFHVEGPFLNPEPGFAGAHPADKMRPAEPAAAARLYDAGAGQLKLVTLAPECDRGARTTRWLTGHGVRVAAGHTDASLEQLRAAIDEGLTIFTHLGNGCARRLDRHDNIIQRALALREHLWLCFIPDGAHIPWFALDNYLRLAGVGRSVFVTDAISAARMPPGDYHLGRLPVHVGSDMVCHLRDSEHLAGSTLTWPRIRREAAAILELSETTMHRLAFTNPAQALGLPAA